MGGLGCFHGGLILKLRIGVWDEHLDLWAEETPGRLTLKVLCPSPCFVELATRCQGLDFQSSSLLGELSARVSDAVEGQVGQRGVR
jgi:hypothetical protein